MCSVFYINKNGSHGGHFTSGIKTQTCSPKNSHPGLQETPRGGVILGTWDSVLGTDDPDEAVNNLETLIHRHMDKCMPFRTVCISSRDPAWVTPLLKSLMRSKSRIGQNMEDRLRAINRRILSQRRCSSAKVTLDMQSLVELNDYFAELCWDSAYKQPTPAQVESPSS